MRPVLLLFAGSLALSAAGLCIDDGGGGCFIPPPPPAPSPCLPPFCTRDPNALVSVELFSNMPPDLSFGDDLDALLIPLLAASEVPLRERVMTGSDQLPPLDGVPCSCKTYGSITLTDQQPVSIRFTSPCPPGRYPCTFGLKRLSVILAAQPPHPWCCSATSSWSQMGGVLPFGNNCPEATVSFKIELGRYFKTSSGATDVEVQTAIWTRKFLVRGDDQLYHLSLQGLIFSVWNPSSLPYRLPGDMKVIITPFIHYQGVSYDAVKQPGQVLWKLSKPSWIGTTPTARFDFAEATAFQMRPGCPPNDGQLIYDQHFLRERMLSGAHLAEEMERHQQREERLLWTTPSPVAPSCSATPPPVAASCSPSHAAPPPPPLPLYPPWCPDVCLFKDHWTCIPAFPSMDLEALIPCSVAFDVVSSSDLNLNTLFSGIEFEPTSTTTNAEPLPLTETALLAPSLNTLIISATALPALPPPPSPRPPPPPELLPWPVFRPHDCPDFAEDFSRPYIGADTTAFGRYTAPNCESINTRSVANTTGLTDILLLFRAPCHRCSLYLRKAWLPLAKDLSNPECCSNTNKLQIHSYVGLWTRGSDCRGSIYPLDSFDCTSSGHPNGAHTEVCLSDTHLEQATIWLGDETQGARIDIPNALSLYQGGELFIGIKLQVSCGFKLGAGFSRRHGCLCEGDLVDYSRDPLVWREGCVCGDEASSGLRITPAELFVSSSSRHPSWVHVQDFVPGIFLPVDRVEPHPLCPNYPRPPPPPFHGPSCAPQPSPSHNSAATCSPSGGGGGGNQQSASPTKHSGGGGGGNNNSPTPSPTRHSASPTRHSASPSPTRHSASPSKSKGWHGGLSSAGGATDGSSDNTSSESSSRLARVGGKGGLAGIIIGLLVALAVVLLVAGLIIRRQREKKAGNSAAAVAGAAVAAGGAAGAAGKGSSSSAVPPAAGAAAGAAATGTAVGAATGSKKAFKPQATRNNATSGAAATRRTPGAASTTGAVLAGEEGHGSGGAGAASSAAGTGIGTSSAVLPPTPGTRRRIAWASPTNLA